jgi:hypothetical protein
MHEESIAKPRARPPDPKELPTAMRAPPPPLDITPFPGRPEKRARSIKDSPAPSRRRGVKRASPPPRGPLALEWRTTPRSDRMERRKSGGGGFAWPGESVPGATNQTCATVVPMIGAEGEADIHAAEPPSAVTLRTSPGYRSRSGFLDVLVDRAKRADPDRAERHERHNRD